MRQVRQQHLYEAIRQAKEEYGHPIELSCKILGVSRAAYYNWASGKKTARQAENERIARCIEEIHNESPDKGYRRIRDDLFRYYETDISDKRTLRICRYLDVKSTIKYQNKGCTRNSQTPQFLAENILNRNFHVTKPNEVWLTDVTEFKYFVGFEKRRLYLSAILDLYDRRIVSWVIRDSNDNKLVFDTVDMAIKANPGAHPLFHSDRGYQYTNRTFHDKLARAGMTQSMSRVGKCLDNGPMEGFWGIIKRERYYGHRFDSREALIQMISSYIHYYNNKRLQRNLGVLTPQEKHDLFFAA